MAAINATLKFSTVACALLLAAAAAASETSGPVRWLYPTSFYPASLFSPFGEQKAKFGNRRHLGEDIARPAGSDVYAAQSGTVIYTQTRDTSNADCKGWGTMVAIAHTAHRVTSIYAHLQKPLPVQRGQNVRIGEKIGKIGHYTSNGAPCYRDHLHFAIYDGLFPLSDTGYPMGLTGYAGDDLFPARYCRPSVFIETGKCER